MAKNKNESNNENSGTLLTEKDGTQYLVMGKVRIKVSEHFAQDGKPLDRDRKSTRLNSSHRSQSRMPSSA